MKITCDAYILNRNLPRLNWIKKQSMLSTVALCYKDRRRAKTDADAALIIYNTRYSGGKIFEICSNVHEIKNMNGEAAIIKFKDPAYDIMITKADPLELTELLQGIQLINVAKGTGNVNISPPMNTCWSKKFLSVTKQSDYPSKKKGFPPSLLDLHIQIPTLTEIDSRILNLCNLQVLNLSSNIIKELPVALAELELKELILDSNQIAGFPTELATGPLGQSLLYLDLSYNRLSTLSPSFCFMQNLQTLKLKRCRIKNLPRNIHLLKSLRVLNISDNKLTHLPYGLKMMGLEILDCFRSPLKTEGYVPNLDSQQIPSLLKFSASAIVEHGVPYHNLPRILKHYVLDHCICVCGKYVFHKNKSCIYLEDLQNLASSVAYGDDTRHQYVPLEVFTCSRKCWEEFYPEVEIWPPNDF